MMLLLEDLMRLWPRLVLLAGLAFSSAASHADGSLAVSTTGTPHFGLSINERFGQAEQSALKRCGKDCKVASRFEDGCAAFASGRYAMGWNVGATPEEASFGALQQCRGYGTDCVVRKTVCESKGSTPGAVVSQQSQQRTSAPRSPDAVLDTPPNAVRQINAATQSSDNWAVADVRTGMSPAEVRTVLERAGYKLSIYQSYYRYRHPVSGMPTQDDATPMVSLITGRAQAAQPEDTVTVLFTPTPGAEKVYAVGKAVSYTRQLDQAVSLEILRKTAIEKYGVPQIDGATQAAGNYALYWAASRSLGQLKPWVSEPDLGSVAIGCGSNALQGAGVAVTFSHMSPLAVTVGMPPQAMRDHCGERFLAGRLSLSATGSWVNSQSNGVMGIQTQVMLKSDVPVLQYQFSLYDAALAQAGQSVLMSAETELTVRAAKKQAEMSGAAKPRL